MSVQTTADEKCLSAKQNIKAAIRDLSEIVIEECHGHDEFRPEYREELRKVLYELIELREKVK